MVPSNVLSNKMFTGQLELTCSNYNHILIVSSTAFGANKFYKVSINGCNLDQQLDFAFMSGLNELRQFWMYRVSNLHSFSGVPAQSSLYQVLVTSSRGFETLNDAKVALPGLRELYLYSNGLTDATAERVLSALASSSTNSLVELRLYDNQLTVIPQSVGSYRRLVNLMMNTNRLRVLTAGSLNFSSTPAAVGLHSNVIERVEPGAFNGNVNALDLTGNKLTKFESASFKPLLDSFHAKRSGEVWLHDNNFMCDCHLEWLIKDNRHLLDYVKGASCGNSTSFMDLSPNGYDGCPTDEFKCPVIDGNYSAGPCKNYYYACSGGFAYKMYCPDYMVFEEWNNMCLSPVGCP